MRRPRSLPAWIAAAVLGACAAPPPPPPAPPLVVAPPSVAAPAPAPPPPPPVEAACPPLDLELPAPRDLPGAPTPEIPPLVDPTGEAMAPFYLKVARLLRGKARDHVRIAVYGDSNMTMDYISGGMRRLLQGKYGDAGHGFVALGRPWSHYRHQDVKHGPRFGFESYAVTTRPIPDAAYGFSGIAAQSSQTGATAFVATADPPAPVGTSAGKVGVFYLLHPGYGGFSVRVDGQSIGLVGTDAPTVSAGYYQLPLCEGPHQVELVVETARTVRLLGAVLEGTKPGIVVDSLGVGALNTQSQRREDPVVNQAMLRQRPWDLVIFMTGTNDILQLPDVPAWLGDVIAVHRAVLPGVPVLITSPPDRGQIRSYEPTLAVGKQRREIAAQQKAAFWDLWAAMGGHGSMARFHDLGLSTKSDYIHFSDAGGAWIGERLVHALWRDLGAFLAKSPRAGCE